jgi:hypothetical protein
LGVRLFYENYIETAATLRPCLVSHALSLFQANDTHNLSRPADPRFASRTK